MDTKQFYANGKLLLSGEYFVLDGALALAVPLIKGQSLLVRQSFGMPHLLEWESLAIDNKTWFKAHFDLTNGKTLFSSDETVSQRILQLFDYISKSQPTFTKDYWNQGSRLQRGWISIGNLDLVPVQPWLQI